MAVKFVRTEASAGVKGAVGSPASDGLPPGLAAGEITYKGYRIEPESYCVKTTMWSPRAIVSVSTDGGWLRRPPLYSPSTARFPTREEADVCALDVARAWIDTTVEGQRG